LFKDGWIKVLLTQLGRWWPHFRKNWRTLAEWVKFSQIILLSRQVIVISKDAVNSLLIDSSQEPIEILRIQLEGSIPGLGHRLHTRLKDTGFLFDESIVFSFDNLGLQRIRHLITHGNTFFQQEIDLL
jgi:hypothetical protein